jgi:hypothetical protein
MATIGKLAIAAMTALVLVGTAGARLREVVAVTSPAPKRPAGTAPVADPAEPPLAVQASFDNGAAPTPGARRPVAVAGGPRNTTLTLDTPGLWHGSASLAFKGEAPPMRLSVRLMKMQAYDLQALTLTSGSVSLAVGPVTAGVTTRYFDARGRAQDAPEGAAYTVVARRWEGEVEVQVRRSRGVALGKNLTISWRSNVGYGYGRGVRLLEG